MSRMSELPQAANNLPAQSEEELLIAAAAKDVSFPKMLKFTKSGTYVCNAEEIPLGTEMIAHPLAFTREWVKFVDGIPADRKTYPALRGIEPPPRETLGDLDERAWKNRMDPWSLQFMIPMEFRTIERDNCVFVGPSQGARRACSDLVTAWARKRQKFPGTGMPIIKLSSASFHSPTWGEVKRPYFEIIGWEGGERESIREFTTAELREDIRKEMGGDDIPF